MASSEHVALEGPVKIDPAPAPDPDAVVQAARLLAAAERPMIIVGSGAQHAAAEVRALAEELDAPVTAMRGGRGIMSEDSPLGLFGYAAYLLWEKTDALIAIGSRAPEDWLLRLAYSGGFGTERRLDVPSWWTVQDYGEVGHYVSNGWNYATGWAGCGSRWASTASTGYPT